MKEISDNQKDIQESISPPAVGCIVHFIKYTESDEDGPTQQLIDVTNYLKTFPQVTEATDYREGLVYIAETSFVLNNESKYFTTDDETGWLDEPGDTMIEAIVYHYLAHPSVDENTEKVRKWAGWLDLGTLKHAPHPTMDVEISAYNYLGLGDKRQGYLISTQEFGEHGLNLHNVKAWFRDANIVNYKVKAGVHAIYAHGGPGKQFKFDDGEWVNSAAGDITLVNADGTQKVKVKDMGDAVGDDDVSTIFVQKDEGQQYPNILFRDASLPRVIRKCFNEIEISETDIEPYEIETHDGRYEFQKYPPVQDSIWNGYAQEAHCLFVNGSDVYLGLGDEIWKFNAVFQEYTKLCTIEATRQVKRLVYTEIGGSKYLFAWTQLFFSTEKWLYKIDLADNSKHIIYSRFDNDSIGIWNSMHWSEDLKKFILIRNTTKVETLDKDGNFANAVTGLTNLLKDGLSFVWKNETMIFYYYIEHVNGTNIRLRRAGYDTETLAWGADEFVMLWHNEAKNEKGRAFIMPASQTVFILWAYNSGEYTYGLLDLNSHQVDLIDTSGWKLYSPIDFENTTFLLAVAGTDQKIVKIVESEVVDVSGNYDELYFIETESTDDNIQRFALTKNWQDTDVMTILAAQDRRLLRYSNWLILFIEGDADFTDMTIKDVLVLIANNFLGYLKVTSERLGLYVNRENYDSGSTIALKKTYTKSRVRESAYNDKYDRIVVSNGKATQDYGDTNLDALTLQLDLPLCPTVMLKDVAAYEYGYYSKERKIKHIGYIPSMLQIETLDKADLSEFGVIGSKKRFHKIVQSKESAEIEILVTP